MTRISLIAALIFSFSGLIAQDLHIYYDVFRDSIWYMSNGKSLNRPIVRHGSQVNFHLVEYNRYALQTGIQTLQEDISPEMATGSALLPDPLGVKAAGSIGAPPSNAGKITILSSFEEYPSMPAIPAIGNARGPLSEVVQTLEDLHGLDRSIRSGFQEVEELEQAFLQIEDMGEALDAMLGNPFLPPSLVQEEPARYREVLDKKSVELDFRQSASRHRRLLRSLKDQRDSLSLLVETVEVQQALWQDSDQEPVQALVQTMGQAIAVSGQYKKLLEESIELAEEFDEQLQQKSPSEWENLRLRLKEVDMTPFSLHSQQLAERDQLTYEVAIQIQGEVAERLGMEAGQAFRKRIIKVSAYGDLRSMPAWAWASGVSSSQSRSTLFTKV
ncbi:MAG: hypothetical protein IPJ40_09660 [Saprospirales bacterium]|nr:hypothetical protein [Saprospirales bacterium]